MKAASAPSKSGNEPLALQPCAMILFFKPYFSLIEPRTPLKSSIEHVLGIHIP